MLKRPDIHPEIIFVEPLSKERRSDLQQICTEAKNIPVVVLSISRDPQNIVAAVKVGVQDYVYKPIEPRGLSRTISSILELRANSPSQQPQYETQSVEFVFSSPQMRQIHHTALQIAKTNVPVLIGGESGVGKDIVARLIHQKSRLRGRPFVKVNCAAMPAELVESELFGYRKGAFTGAHTDRPGKFEFANMGTIFLDEIGEFTPSIQAKLLQVLQEGRFTRLGSNRESRVDVRIIAATNRKLEEAIDDGTFREDLFYRLNVVNMEIPPLRQRREEIPLLCQYFFKKFGTQYNSSVKTLPRELQRIFSSYYWPGNIRELENLIKRYIVLQDAETIKVELEGKIAQGNVERIDAFAQFSLQNNGESLNLKQISKQAAAVAEKDMIKRMLLTTNWNKWKAAKELKVSYKTLLTKIEQYRIKPPR